MVRQLGDEGAGRELVGVEPREGAFLDCQLARSLVKKILIYAMQEAFLYL
jgi:hypothetical protein